MAKPAKCKTIIFIANLCLCYINIFSNENNRYPEYLLTLESVYGESFDIVDSNTIKWNDGELLLLDDGVNKNPKELIESGDISDQFKMVYPKGELFEPPATPENDPGRIRNNKFFKKLYGGTPEEVKMHLKELKWMPQYSNEILLFNTKFKAWENLKKVSDELEKLPPELLKYVVDTAGTYNWRVIKDTNRLSAHSFGIAIDINVKYSSYWKWDKEYKYRNEIPHIIIKIFEDHGFIWGGKWYHYDTMHFEYRPELL